VNSDDQSFLTPGAGPLWCVFCANPRVIFHPPRPSFFKLTSRRQPGSRSPSPAAAGMIHQLDAAEDEEIQRSTQDENLLLWSLYNRNTRSIIEHCSRKMIVCRRLRARPFKFCQPASGYGRTDYPPSPGAGSITRLPNTLSESNRRVSELDKTSAGVIQW